MWEDRERSHHVGKGRSRLAKALAVMLLAQVWPATRDATADQMILLDSEPLSAPYIYSSTSMDPVSVSIEKKSEGDENGQILATFNIPRAYIYMAEGYEHGRFRELPANIRVGELVVMPTYPDGLPHTVFSERLLGDPATGPHEAGALTHDAAMRGHIMTTSQPEFLAPERGGPMYFQGKPRDDHEHLDDAFGLRHYRWDQSIDKFYGNGEDRFISVECYRFNHSRSPCTYNVSLNDNLWAAVHFLDFRFHGGVAFANDRLGVFLDVVCRYVECRRG